MAKPVVWTRTHPLTSALQEEALTGSPPQTGRGKRAVWRRELPLAPAHRPSGALGPFQSRTVPLRDCPHCHPHAQVGTDLQPRPPCPRRSRPQRRRRSTSLQDQGQRRPREWETRAKAASPPSLASALRNRKAGAEPSAARCAPTHTRNSTVARVASVKRCLPVLSSEESEAQGCGRQHLSSESLRRRRRRCREGSRTRFLASGLGISVVLPGAWLFQRRSLLGADLSWEGERRPLGFLLTFDSKQKGELRPRDCPCKSRRDPALDWYPSSETHKRALLTNPASLEPHCGYHPLRVNESMSFGKGCRDDYSGVFRIPVLELDGNQQTNRPLRSKEKNTDLWAQCLLY
ncbi:uncharacterized protein LOC103276051 [Carlito syrichta]|uniref:Uncharacterized protein LOC103276051 n=1 Tax=Carlito syrichta TaxID=1868482 RepID=A0A3Q0DD64_CARSF|nr:uncharacterized protein LOC103276051 [Carlito syrichta]